MFSTKYLVIPHLDSPKELGKKEEEALGFIRKTRRHNGLNKKPQNVVFSIIHKDFRTVEVYLSPKTFFT